MHMFTFSNELLYIIRVCSLFHYRNNSITMFMRHDVEHQLVGLVHAFRTDFRQITDTEIHIIFNDTFY